jgi:hypothetical protein
LELAKPFQPIKAAFNNQLSRSLKAPLSFFRPLRARNCIQQEDFRHPEGTFSSLSPSCRLKLHSPSNFPAS